MKKRKEGAILKLMIGNDEYESLITDATREFNNMKLSSSIIEPIMESYSTAILLIGISQPNIEQQGFNILLDKENTITINVSEFYSKHERYIQKVKQFILSLEQNLNFN